MKFRKKPVVIEAFKWMHDEVPDWWVALQGTELSVHDGSVIIPTLEGEMKANVGDYIIRGVAGETYPCRPDIFEMTYEPVGNEVSHDKG